MATVLNAKEQAKVGRYPNRRRDRFQGIELPNVSRFLNQGFNWYVPRYLRRHFSTVRVARNAAPVLNPDRAVICFANHSGWWDPLIATLLNQLFMGGRTAYAPIDQDALDNYPVFRRLGFYGIDLDSLRGAKQFLAVTRELLKHAETAIWMTPGGTFADVRSRTTFQPGLAHLAATVSEVTLVPLALEYTFWEERTPEALVEFGEPVTTRRRKATKEEWRQELEDRLAAVQASLARKAIARAAEEFEIVLDGSAGVGGWYDVLRRAKSFLAGRSFEPRHGHVPTRNQTDV